MDFYKSNGEWYINWTSVQNNTGHGADMSVLDFSIHLTRRSDFFILSMITPILLPCFLNPFVFLLPASSGERISYTITMFLSLAVYMTLIGENMPKTSDPMAGISYLLLVSMVYNCVLILLTIFTLRCYCVKDIRKYPGWFLWLVDHVANLTSRMNKKDVTAIEDLTDDRTMTDATLKDDGSGNDVKEMGSKRNLQIEYMTRFIDISLFCITLTVTFVKVLVFVTFYWNG
ncbi:acetylcholine receptor subunit beta-type lev-1-like [Pecten maximus]|uniref:acetylcholine receptor subunit beta-type lev-1-like n=1 Tax=Pecten maximus TaxID=6579 RepID=UPI0014585E88|nr:acetylcholine receptor subunit beta-type lev-1-like [Pecten maximus]